MLTTEFNDSLDDLFNASASAEARPRPAPPASYQQPVLERCTKCGGSGRYTRGMRDFGPCFTCKGAGKRAFKTSADQRATARTQRADREVRKADQHLDEFKAEFGVEHAWMTEEATRFGFAASMLQAVRSYGRLTDNQLAAVRKCMLRKATAQAGAAARVAAAKAISMDKVEAAFARAGAQLKRPRLQVAGLTITPAKAGSANAGALYVREPANDAYLGKIFAGRFIRSRECTDEQEAKVITTASDPAKAAADYGHMTGNCACCGRRLDNPESIARGIGPVCAENYGW